MNMGAGRVAFQDLTRIDGFIRDGDLFENPVLTAAMARGTGRSLHFIGLSLLIGISRVLLGAHYPTDVLADWAVGFGWVGICRATLGFFEKDNEQIELEEADPENVEVKV